ncbi:elongation factor P maturation arginine rhamnosyltransferase EarP [Pusillimonas minor]|uniref:Protein-arginine rhamnosyltransferase n=1 Tax=Pusillimonas minor TaxID=2697024 RepID=A0A842HRR1_9BURK|nr:elongation factor P maturation arginine rhamnosyltransferase EarP [Pusillimonas minor]MBC2770514.1 elongation factor P maturation arginine rhamnosyltransferase EarP [Pusillimonas minor]
MHFDIFCRVIDNFGDIGVCWRLARQLAHAPNGHHVTLWVDDIHRFQRIEASITLQPVQSLTHNITVVHWTTPALLREPGDVVIEAFSCDPPQTFIDAMKAKGSLWINLEYLSAEDWVESCHALPSLQSNGLRKFFFFPGFTPKTGGLLREHDLLAQRDAWQSDSRQRVAQLAALNVPADVIAGLQTGWRQALLFGYPGAPATALTDALEATQTPWVVLVPQGMHPDIINVATPHVRVVEIPFVDQAGFDRLLWRSDLNFVRGEDSLVRALWAGKPLVWQIYEQEDDTHLIKLQAWLAHSGYPDAVGQLMLAWNKKEDSAARQHLDTLLQGPAWDDWVAAAARWTDSLAQQPDLATNLTAFCARNC